MSLWKLVTAVLTFQLVIADENCPGIHLSTGLGTLVGDFPLSSSIPQLPILPTVDSCSEASPSFPTLPSLPSEGYGLPALPSSAPRSCLRRRSLLDLCKPKCGCREPCGQTLYQPPIAPISQCEPSLEPYPLLKPKCGCCLTEHKNKLKTRLLEKLIQRKGLALGIGPNYGVELSCLPDAVSTFAIDALAGPLTAGIGDEDECY